MNKKLAEIIGWCGVLMLLSAYALLNFHVIYVNDFSYQFLNLIGSVSIIIISLFKRAYQPAVLNIIWAIIAMIALFQIIFL
ncbi:MAG: CBU_0592 family membrane protein [Nanoarchaeota archaeon]